MFSGKTFSSSLVGKEQVQLPSMQLSSDCKAKHAYGLKLPGKSPDKYMRGKAKSEEFNIMWLFFIHQGE